MPFSQGCVVLIRLVQFSYKYVLTLQCRGATWGMEGGFCPPFVLLCYFVTSCNIFAFCFLGPSGINHEMSSEV